MRNQPMVLKNILEKAQREGYAVGSFNCRYSPMIRAVLQAAQSCSSPVSIQISQRELQWFGINIKEFAEEVLYWADKDDITVPYALHLDHTWEMDIIKEAIDAGFTSVMIDASKHELEENIRITREVVDYAHQRGVTVEGELGKIGSADKLETEYDEVLYTVPEEAERFVEETGVDYLAVSIGTAHGIYLVKNPKIDFNRLKDIRSLVDIPLVLHGGTGVPEESIKRAIEVEGGGISKVNIATELEMALLESLSRTERMTPQEIRDMDEADVKRSREAVKRLVEEKMRNFLGSAGRV
jgi:ketose-bisphosphate aldolase